MGKKWNSLGPEADVTVVQVELVVTAPPSLETFGLSLRAGISIFHGKLFTLNPLNAIYIQEISEEFEHHYLLNIPDFKQTSLLLVLGLTLQA